MRASSALTFFFLLAALLPAVASADDGFEETSWTLYLTGATGTVNGHADVLLLSPDGPTGGPAATDPPGIPLLDQAGLSAASTSWYSTDQMLADREITRDVAVDLYFSFQLQASSTIVVRLLAVHADGSDTFMGQDSRAVTASSTLPTSETFYLPTTGMVLREGDVVRLEVATESLSVVTDLDYGSAQSPSAVRDLTTRLLDRDGDGLGDTFERSIGTDPTDADSDGDGIGDRDELVAGSDPKDRGSRPGDASDRDQDGLPDSLELLLGTDPHEADSDGDGYGDGMEFRAGTQPLEAGDAPLDTDGDGLPDAVDPAPTVADADGDGVSDCDEDLDGDGLSACQEAAYGTDPADADSDDDGTTDGTEVADGSAPTVNPDDIANGAEVMELGAAAGLLLAASAIIGYALLGRFPL